MPILIFISVANLMHHPLLWILRSLPFLIYWKKDHVKNNPFFSRNSDVIKYSCRFFLTYSAMLGLINGLHFNNLHLVRRIFKNSFLKMAKNKSRNTFAHLGMWQFLFVKVLSNNCYLGKQKILLIHITYSWKKTSLNMYLHTIKLRVLARLG